MQIYSTVIIIESVSLYVSRNAKRFARREGWIFNAIIAAAYCGGYEKQKICKTRPRVNQKDTCVFRHDADVLHSSVFARI